MYWIWSVHLWSNEEVKDGKLLDNFWVRHVTNLVYGFIVHRISGKNMLDITENFT